MYKAVLTLLLGLMLSVSGSAWGETEQDAEKKEMYKVLGLYGDTFQVFRNQYVKVESNKDEVYSMLGLFGDIFQRLRESAELYKNDKDLIDRAISGFSIEIVSGREITDKGLIMASIRSMLSFDPYGGYCTHPRQNTATEVIGGIGVEIKSHKMGAEIVGIFPDSPAQELKLKKNDILVEIDGKKIQSFAPCNIMKLIRGPLETEVEIAIRRADGGPLRFKLIRKPISGNTTPPFDLKIIDKAIYVKVSRFERGLSKDLASELLRIRKEFESSEARSRGIILDLRESRGGFLTEITSVIDMFIPSGTLFMTDKTRDDKPPEKIESTTADILSGMGIVTLVNESSLARTNLLASALQDSRRSLLIGKKTTGPALISGAAPVSKDEFIIFTTGQFLTSQGNSLENGVTPDVVIAPRIGLVGINNEQFFDPINCGEFEQISDPILNCALQFLDYADALASEQFRSATFSINNKSEKTVVAFSSAKTSSGFETKGLALISGELCTSYSSIETTTGKSAFEVKCPSGYSAEGTFKPKGDALGSIGNGQDIYGNKIQYLIHAAEGDFKISRAEFLKAVSENITLKTLEKPKQRIAVLDKQVPLITIISSSSNGPQGRINGRVTDNTGVGEVRVDGQLVSLDGNGNFAANTYVPEGGISIIVEAYDLAGLSSSMSVRLSRDVVQTASISFDRLNPLGKRVKPNRDALALIVGVADYENTPAKAIFADSDALMFRDYASEKLGIPENRIKTLVDDGADERQLLLSVKNWLSRAVKQDQSDVYVFFAGHGLASDDGEKMYLLPYDGAPELLDDTAISRERLFADISAANPRSVTVFLDTCYSGTTRGPDMLIASRPIAIRTKESAIPEGFTVMTAAAGDQTAKPLEEAKHGMFSYFLMKGMEGDADANQDNQITAGELHAYVQQNVIQQSSGSQTPELQGDADRVLVRFQ